MSKKGYSYKIYSVGRGYFIIITFVGGGFEQAVYLQHERMTMLARINELFGEEPENLIGLEMS